MIAARNWPPVIQPPRPNPNANPNNTGTYMDVIQEADRGNYWQRPDGQVSWQELQQYRQQLHQQLNWSRWFGGNTDQVLAKLQATNNMLNNYGNMAGASDGNWSGISYGDVWATAIRDGNGANVSWRDLQGGWGWPPPQPPIYQPNYFQFGNAGGARF